MGYPGQTPLPMTMTMCPFCYKQIFRRSTPVLWMAALSDLQNKQLEESVLLSLMQSVLDCWESMVGSVPDVDTIIQISRLHSDCMHTCCMC